MVNTIKCFEALKNHICMQMKLVELFHPKKPHMISSYIIRAGINGTRDNKANIRATSHSSILRSVEPAAHLLIPQYRTCPDKYSSELVFTRCKTPLC